MKQILTEEIFSAPQWTKIMCYISSLVVMLTGICLLTVKDPSQEIFFVMPFMFLIAVSMLVYARLRLIISDSGIRFIGGLKSHHFTWEDITMIDMRRLGKYKTPTATIYYSGKELDLQKGFYLQSKFNRILSLLEMKAAPELFTENYKNIRQEIKQNI